MGLQFSGVAARNKAGWSPLASAAANLQVGPGTVLPPWNSVAAVCLRPLIAVSIFLFLQVDCARTLIGEAGETLVHQRSESGLATAISCEILKSDFSKLLLFSLV